MKENIFKNLVKCENGLNAQLVASLSTNLRAVVLQLWNKLLKTRNELNRNIWLVTRLASHVWYISVFKLLVTLSKSWQNKAFTVLLYHDCVSLVAIALYQILLWSNLILLASLLGVLNISFQIYSCNLEETLWRNSETLWRNTVKNHCEEPLWRNIMKNHYEEPLWRTTMKNRYEEPLWRTAMKNRYEEPLWRTTVKNHCEEQVWRNTMKKHYEETLWRTTMKKHYEEVACLCFQSGSTECRKKLWFWFEFRESYKRTNSCCILGLYLVCL